jgi:hypothetical protein
MVILIKMAICLLSEEGYKISPSVDGVISMRQFKIEDVFILITVEENTYLTECFSNTIPPFIYNMEKWLHFKTLKEGIKLGKEIVTLLKKSITVLKENKYLGNEAILADAIAEIIYTKKLRQYFVGSSSCSYVSKIISNPDVCCFHTMDLGCFPINLMEEFAFITGYFPCIYELKGKYFLASEADIGIVVNFTTSSKSKNNASSNAGNNINFSDKNNVNSSNSGNTNLTTSSKAKNNVSHSNVNYTKLWINRVPFTKHYPINHNDVDAMLNFVDRADNLEVLCSNRLSSRFSLKYVKTYIITTIKILIKSFSKRIGKYYYDPTKDVSIPNKDKQTSGKDIQTEVEESKMSKGVTLTPEVISTPQVIPTPKDKSKFRKKRYGKPKRVSFVLESNPEQNVNTLLSISEQNTPPAIEQKADIETLLRSPIISSLNVGELTFDFTIRQKARDLVKIKPTTNKRNIPSETLISPYDMILLNRRYTECLLFKKHVIMGGRNTALEKFPSLGYISPQEYTNEMHNFFESMYINKYYSWKYALSILSKISSGNLVKVANLIRRRMISKHGESIGKLPRYLSKVKNINKWRTNKLSFKKTPNIKDKLTPNIKDKLTPNIKDVPTFAIIREFTPEIRDKITFPLKNKSIETGREVKSFETDREVKSFETGREVKSFETGREVKSFETGREVKSFETNSPCQIEDNKDDEAHQSIDNYDLISCWFNPKVQIVPPEVEKFYMKRLLIELEKYISPNLTDIILKGYKTFDLEEVFANMNWDSTIKVGSIDNLSADDRCFIACVFTKRNSNTLLENYIEWKNYIYSDNTDLFYGQDISELRTKMVAKDKFMLRSPKSAQQYLGYCPDKLMPLNPLASNTHKDN